MNRLTKHITKKKVLFMLIVLVLFIPMIQQNLNIFSKNNLRGSYKLSEKPELSLNSWVNGEFQSKSQMYLNDHLGFRPLFVRIYNQMHYSFYNTAKANSVIVGKDNYLYEENYIKAHLGLDYIGEKAIKDKVYKIKKIQDTLASKGIDLIVMLAPGKASFYPEYIPDSFYEKAIDSTNYKTYKKEIVANNINLLDFNKWFIDLKGTVEYKLFPKNGIHWSRSAQVLVIDSLLKTISKIQNVILPSIQIDSTYNSSEMIGSEQDIEDGMNLLIDIPDFEMTFPSIKYIGENESNVKMLTISDSYYGGLLNFDLNIDVFKNCQNWYYNKLIYVGNQDSIADIESIDIQTEVEKNDVILLMATDANLYKFAFGFIDDVYDIYYTKLEDRISYKKEQRILDFMESMRADEMQNQQIKEKALNNNISFEEELRANAKYMIWVEDGKP
jgi:hypothetical protein